MGIKAANSGELDISCLAAGTVSGMVRTLVEFRLVEWGLERIAGDVLLIGGELMANAVRIALLTRSQLPRIGHSDSSSQLPSVPSTHAVRDTGPSSARMISSTVISPGGRDRR